MTGIAAKHTLGSLIFIGDGINVGGVGKTTQINERWDLIKRNGWKSAGKDMLVLCSTSDFLLARMTNVM